MLTHPKCASIYEENVCSRLRLVLFSSSNFLFASLRCTETYPHTRHSHCFVWCHTCVLRLLLLVYFSSNPFLLCFPLKLVSTKLSLFSLAVCVFRPFLIGFFFSFSLFRCVLTFAFKFVVFDFLSVSARKQFFFFARTYTHPKRKRFRTVLETMQWHSKSTVEKNKIE